MRLRNWWQFTRERFEPASHLLMVGLFCAGHFAASAILHDNALALSAAEQALIFFAALVFFFKLRLFDEIKDYAFDLQHNPTRPLARGLLKVSELRKGIFICDALALLLLGVVATPSLSGLLPAIAYSWLMFKEFFIGEKLRPHLTTYAVTHTFVSVLISLTLLCAAQKQSLSALTRPELIFALNSWFIFNIFEFGRKTFASAEERPSVDSYAKVFGRLGAVLLVLSQALGSILCLYLALPTSAHWAVAGLTLGLAGVGILYLIRDLPVMAKVYRGFSSVFIIAVYLAVIATRSPV